MSEDWSDWNESDENEQIAYLSLFDETPFTTVEELLEYDSKLTQGVFRLVDFIHERNLDEYSAIKLINYIRSLKGEEKSPIEIARKVKTEAEELWRDDKYLLPTLQNDLLLTLNFADLTGNKGNEGDDVKALREENLRLKRELEWLRLDPSTQQEIKSILEDTEEMTIDPKPNSVLQDRRRIDSLYFSSYNSVSIHREMLEDKVRMEAYQSAIEGNQELFKDKTVLDVGCGTGILSLFARRAGAKHIFAIDASPWATKMARSIAQENNYLTPKDSNQITVICGKLEESEDHLEPVDVIISEWMGYALLFESMLDTVLYARDKWLKSDGVILPNKARLFIAGVSSKALDLDFWKDVCGFSMESVAKDIHRESVKTPIIRQVPPEHLLTTSVLIKEFDLASMSAEDADFTSSFLLERVDSTREGEDCHGIVLWFNVEFSDLDSSRKSVVLDTSPDGCPTHWGQTVLTFHSPLGGSIEGDISISKAEEDRSLDISLHCKSQQQRPPVQFQTMVYTLSVQS